jgi:hypothetical protein
LISERFDFASIDSHVVSVPVSFLENDGHGFDAFARFEESHGVELLEAKDGGEQELEAFIDG